MTAKRKEREKSDLKNSLRCEAICVAHHLLPPIAEIREWMSSWKQWESERPSWFVTNRIVLLTNLDANALGKDWVLQNFWGSGDDELMWLAAVCKEHIRPPQEEVSKWLHSRVSDWVTDAQKPDFWEMRWQINLALDTKLIPHALKGAEVWQTTF